MSDLSGTVGSVASAGTADALVSHTGVPLTRATTLKFTLDVNREQHRLLLAHAGAARLAFNHHLGRVQANLDQRAAERSYGIPDDQLTPALSWSKVSFINEMNSWKDGRAPDARSRSPRPGRWCAACRGAMRCPRTCSRPRA